MTVTLPHVFGTEPPSPPLPLSFLDDNFAALVAAVNALSQGGGGTSVIGHVPIVNPQTGATYTVLSTDSGNVVTGTNAGAIAWTLPQSTGGFAAPWFFYAECLRTSTGSITITPATSTIDGMATLVIQPGGGAMIVADPGGNYQALRYTVKGQLTPGTTNTLSPWAAGVVHSQAHSLSSTPLNFTYYLQCTTAEHNWSIGDIAPLSLQFNTGQVPMSFGADSANTYIVTQTGSGAPLLLDRVTFAQFAITPANWTINLIPYVFS